MALHLDPSRSRPPWWMVLLAGAFAGYYALLVFSDLTRPEPTGLALHVGPSTLTIQSVAAGSPAAGAGLAVGDQVVAAGGLPVRSRLDWHAVEVNYRTGEPLHLDLLRDGQSWSADLVLPRAGWSYWRSAPARTLMSARLVQLITLAIALFVAFKRPFDPAARVGAWALATFATYSLVWPYQIAATWRSLPAVAGVVLWVPAASSFAITAVMLAFFAIFPRRLIRSAWAWIAVWLPIVPSLAVQLHFAWTVVYRPQHATGFGNWTRLYAATTAVYGIAATVLLVVGYRHVTDVTQRRRLRVLLIGSLVGLLGFIPLATAHAWWSTTVGATLFASPLISTGVLLGLVLPISFGYAILRHRLFDVTLIVRRGLQYALARRLLESIVPAVATLFLADLWINRHVPFADILLARGWIYALLAGLAVVARVQRRAWLAALDRRFFREQYNAQLLLRSISDDILAASSLDSIAASIVGRVEAAVHPEWVSLLVLGDGDGAYRAVVTMPPHKQVNVLGADSRIVRLLQLLQRPVEVPATGDRLLRQLPGEELDALRQSRVELLVPVACGERAPQALFALGPKRSEEPYSSEDEDLLHAVGDSLGRLLLRAPVGSSGAEIIGDCPECGTCYDADLDVCPRDGAVPTPVMLPRLLGGRYRLQRRLGRGGMGTVYAALDTALDRAVAVKVLREDLVEGREAALRFQSEARVLAGLVHPNIVTVHDLGVTDRRRAFFVMELLEGLTLREELRRVRLMPPAQVLQVLRGVAAAVDAAHRRQIVHRDLKPENIWLCRTEAGVVPKVLDFGLAKVVGTSRTSVLTDVGQVMGTPPYMAPEHLRGGEPSPDWDLWAFCAIAFEMITGALPPLHDAPDPARFEAVPPALRPLFARALSVNPMARPTSATEFLDELAPLLTSHELSS